MDRYCYDDGIQARYDAWIAALKQLESCINDVTPNAKEIVEAIDILIDAKLARRGD